MYYSYRTHCYLRLHACSSYSTEELIATLRLKSMKHCTPCTRRNYGVSWRELHQSACDVSVVGFCSHMHPLLRMTHMGIFLDAIICNNTAGKYQLQKSDHNQNNWVESCFLQTYVTVCCNYIDHTKTWMMDSMQVEFVTSLEETTELRDDSTTPEVTHRHRVTYLESVCINTC